MVIYDTQTLNITFSEGTQFYVESHLGGGGFGEVFKVRNTANNKHYALKHINAQKHINLKAPDKIMKFAMDIMKEASIKIDSPYVVKCYGLTHLEETDFAILFEYASGETLADWIDNNPRASIETKKQIFEKILLGVKAAHDHGLIHHDLKPENIMITAGNHPMILDFGLAKSASVNMSSGGIKGTPPYIAPEKLMGISATEQFDIFSLGCIFFTMLTGKDWFELNGWTFPPVALFLNGSQLSNKCILDFDPRNSITDNNLKKLFQAATCLNPVGRLKTVGEFLGQLTGKTYSEVKPQKPYEKPVSHATYAPPATHVVSKPRPQTGKSFLILPQIPESEMIFVEGGSFKMGDEHGDLWSACKPVHEVSLNSVYIGKFPVTQELYENITGKNPSHFKGAKRCPVEQVSWYDAVTFCNLLSEKQGKEPCYNINGNNVTILRGAKGYRLPTEAEWEFAARGGLYSKGYKYSGSNNENDVACYDKTSGGQTMPVGDFSGNELGLYDMSGNVWEWCQDWYDEKYYENSPLKNPPGGSGSSYRIMRGGSWDVDAQFCRVADRFNVSPDNRSNFIGFRLAFVP